MRLGRPLRRLAGGLARRAGARRLTLGSAFLRLDELLGGASGIAPSNATSSTGEAAYRGRPGISTSDGPDRSRASSGRKRQVWR